jgi:hypothetical protein
MMRYHITKLSDNTKTARRRFLCVQITEISPEILATYSYDGLDNWLSLEGAEVIVDRVVVQVGGVSVILDSCDVESSQDNSARSIVKNLTTPSEGTRTSCWDDEVGTSIT